MTTLSVTRTVGGELQDADAAYLVITDSLGASVLASTLVASTSEGVYEYISAYLSSGTYTATWTFEVAGQDDEVVSRVFEADTPVSLVTGVTLAELEYRLARMIGPAKKYKAASGTTSAVVITSLRSTLDSGDYEDMYILRRGVLRDGTLIANFNSDDRQRQVDTFTASTGTLTPDRTWNVAPSTDEEIELHYLDPDQELRPVLLEGLKRCYMWDRAEVAVTAATRELNITSYVPWITDPTQIQLIDSAIPGNAALIPAERMMWYKPFLSAGSVYLQTQWLGAGTLYLTALRPHFTYVNNELTMSGPNSDSDVLSVDPQYAVMAGLTQAWIELRPRLTPLAKQDLCISGKDAANKFTEMSQVIANQQPEFLKLRWETEARDYSQVGNA